MFTKTKILPLPKTSQRYVDTSLYDPTVSQLSTYFSVCEALGHPGHHNLRSSEKQHLSFRFL